jgi:hypothetical protein
MSTAPEPPTVVPTAEPADPSLSLDPSLSAYKDYYAKIDWESKHVQAGQIYPLFESPLEGPSKSHGQLYDEIRRTASDMPHCYLMALRDNPRFHAFHRVVVFQPPLGGEVGEWQDKIMIFNGDVRGSRMPQPVYMPPQLLQITATTQKVHSWQAYDFPVGQYEEVSAWKAIYVPPSLVHIFLAGSVTMATHPNGKRAPSACARCHGRVDQHVGTTGIHIIGYLDQGIQPFVVTYLDQKTVGEQKELIETHEQMVDGAPTLSDLLNLKAAAKLPLPTQEKQCHKTLESYGAPHSCARSHPPRVCHVLGSASRRFRNS